MVIKEVETIEEATICDQLLTKLINEEKEYDDNIADNFVVNGWFTSIYPKDNKALYIAILDNKIVGYVYVKKMQLGDSNKEKEEAFIDGLYVIEEYRHKGIASSLINQAKEWCVNNNIKTIGLNVLCSNERAKSFYYKEGFKDNLVNLKCRL